MTFVCYVFTNITYSFPFLGFCWGGKINYSYYKDLRYSDRLLMGLKYIVNVRVSSDCLYHSILINSTIVWTLDLMNLGFSGQDWTLPTRRLATQRYINSHLVVVVFLSCLVKESQNIPRPLLIQYVLLSQTCVRWEHVTWYPSFICFLFHWFEM